MRIAAEPDDEERELLELGGRGRAVASRSAWCSRAYDDEALLREFLTPKVCELSRLYAFEHLEQDPRRIRVSSREADAIREVLIAQHSTLGNPAHQIVDADFRGRGELLLEHSTTASASTRSTRGERSPRSRCCGASRARSGRSRAATTTSDNWFTGHPDGRSERHVNEPRG